ncbi:hypothetical protein SCP_0600930 [Sparassis crispa]|uniref:Uncharacterized protein n=1 Tax=Sparassis crispa TaxID=139825 RepID=A0A401GPF9_9APHY|nr:hypothetical protein SCP_0600930 [Sparassis crispa]GBE84115.1 hypothetical protein SCP_0600930 [Sparassis crispa]
MNSTHLTLHDRFLTSTIFLNEDFFLSPYPETRQEYLGFCERREKDARAWRPYMGTPFSAGVVKQWRSFDLPCLTADPLSDNYRPIPALVQHEAFLREGKISLAMVHPLQIGTRKWSQVWRGSMKMSSADDVLQAAPVVIKIFQQSLFPDPFEYHSEAGGIDCGGWLTGAQQARWEAWAFSRMKLLQGRRIPWSYGIFQIILPHGELAFVHVIEFVEGSSGKELRFGDATATDFWALAEVLASDFYNMTQCGVLHDDIMLSNLIVSPGDPHPVVSIDFAFAQPFTEADLDCGVFPIVYALRDMGMELDTIEAWFKDGITRGVPWSRMFVYQSEKSPRWFKALTGMITPDHAAEEVLKIFNRCLLPAVTE